MSIVIANIRHVKPADYDEVWAIVRSLKSNYSSLIQVEELSPSWNLFKKYLSLRDSGKWNADAFQNIYKPDFMNQIASDPMAHKKLEELISKHNAGKKIALVCFCTDASLCHRSLVAEILASRGIAVQSL